MIGGAPTSLSICEMYREPLGCDGRGSHDSILERVEDAAELKAKLDMDGFMT